MKTQFSARHIYSCRYESCKVFFLEENILIYGSTWLNAKFMRVARRFFAIEKLHEGLMRYDTYECLCWSRTWFSNKLRVATNSSRPDLRRLFNLDFPGPADVTVGCQLEVLEPILFVPGGDVFRPDLWLRNIHSWAPRSWTARSPRARWRRVPPGFRSLIIFCTWRVRYSPALKPCLSFSGTLK